MARSLSWRLAVLLTLPALALALLSACAPSVSAESESSEATILTGSGLKPLINIEPRGRAADTLLIFYPGGFVKPGAYTWLGQALAGRGVQTVIPAFPLNLAVLDKDRAGDLARRFGGGKRIILAGHSLGGAMAAQYAAEHAPELSGLILMAAYPPNNVTLRATSLPTLSLLAERDGVAAPEKVRGGLERLPTNTTLTVLPGAVHAFFGRYGPQRGDGQPTATREDTEARIVGEVEAFLDRLPR